MLESVVRSLVSDFVDISFLKAQKKIPKNLDHVLEYAKETLTMGLVFLQFKDTIGHSDSDRILQCWKFLFLFSERLGIQTMHWKPLRC